MSSLGSNTLLDRLSTFRREPLLLAAAGLLLVIAWVDWLLGEVVTMGAIYLLPVLLLSSVLSRPALLLLASFCAALRLFSSPPMTWIEGVMNGGFAWIAYVLIGLFASELMRSRRAILQHLSEIERQQSLRLRAEEELRLLAESSPAAVFTLNERGEVLSANRATREILGLDSEADLVGWPVGDNFPVLMEALQLDSGRAAFRTVAQVQGKRCNGSPFLAQACFSTYRSTDGGPLRLAAIAFDLTEDTREREEQNQHQMLESNRIIAGAVAHEVRNVCGAMSVLYSNLELFPGLAGNRDYQSLGKLVEGLGKLAGLELQKGDDPATTGIADLRDVLGLLRILIEPAWQEKRGYIDWPELPHSILVTGDSFALLQVFLNIANNSLTAVSMAQDKRLRLTITTSGSFAYLAFRDSGEGVPDPDSLFQPFRTGSGRVGLGLYISRALVRRYGGDVRYEADPNSGAGFIVETPLHGVSNDAVVGRTFHPAVASR